MYDADALEAINGEQLVTATDRLLLRGGQLSKRRHIRRLAEGSQPHIVVARFAEGSQPRIAVADVPGAAARAERAAGCIEDGTRLTFAAERTEEAPRPSFAIDDVEGRTEPDLAIACAWETTVPHPVPARGARPYLGTIVAAPFAAAPHPAPPAHDLDDDYLAAPACARVIASARQAQASRAPACFAARVGECIDAVPVAAPAPAQASSLGLAFIAAAPFASDSYPALHGRASQSRLDEITVPLPAGFDPAQSSQSMPMVRNAEAPRGRGPQQGEPTAVIRCASAPRVQVFAVTVVIPALVGVVVGLAALL